MSKKIIIRALLLLILYAWLVMLNIMVFRSDYPQMWWASFLISLVIVLIIPYNKLFKTK